LVDYGTAVGVTISDESREKNKALFLNLAAGFPKAEQQAIEIV
jgi:hypothetical protein